MSLTHPFIIKAKELFIDQNTETDYLVMEYSNLPSLESIILKQGRLDELKVCLILKSCLEAVSHMHSKGIAHRDLKPDNILVEYPFKNKKEIPIKIIDFGVSARFSHLEEKKAYYDIKTKDMWTRTGNHFYCAPEIFQGGGYN